jgi:hypothetical protein
MLEPIVKSIEVPCSQKQAFEVFVHELGTWWPTQMFSVSAMRKQVTQTIRVEAKKGGKIVEVGGDGREDIWGIIKTYDPYDAFSMDFNINHPDYAQTQDKYTLIEVTFTALGDSMTRVELTQSNWDVFGAMADGIRGGYVKGWSVIFDQKYKAACSKPEASAP